MARDSTVKVEITCDNTGQCCARRKGRKAESFCGMDYKFPWQWLGVTKRQRGELDRGFPVRKLVGRFTWFDMIDAWSDGGLFGRARRRQRR
jgi:hypothetical protein